MFFGWECGISCTVVGIDPITATFSFSSLVHPLYPLSISWRARAHVDFSANLHHQHTSLKDFRCKETNLYVPRAREGSRPPLFSLWTPVESSSLFTCSAFPAFIFHDWEIRAAKFLNSLLAWIGWCKQGLEWFLNTRVTTASCKTMTVEVAI